MARQRRWYRGRIVRGRKAFGVLGAAACAVLLASGCGGGTRQDAGELERTYKLQLLAARFPASQSIARPVFMRVLVRNADTKTIPNLTATVDSFYYTEKFPELASSKRPVWVVERGPGATPSRPVQSQEISPPGGGQTAYVNTWSLGPLAPRQVRAFVWKVVPVKAGSHIVHLRISASLGVKARATLADGHLPIRTFAAHIAPAPPATHVDPNTGKVTAGPFPASP
jgi:hypothetical protein